jgi:tetratricopeptide (TPR) repeat protein
MQNFIAMIVLILSGILCADNLYAEITSPPGTQEQKTIDLSGVEPGDTERSRETVDVGGSVKPNTGHNNDDLHSKQVTTTLPPLAEPAEEQALKYAQQADELYRQDNYDTALDEINRAIGLNNKNGAFYMVRGLIYHDKSRLNLRTNSRWDLKLLQSALADYDTCIILNKDERHDSFYTWCVQKKAEILCYSEFKKYSEGFDLVNTFLKADKEKPSPFALLDNQARVNFLETRSGCYDYRKKDSSAKRLEDHITACELCKTIKGCSQESCRTVAWGQRYRRHELYQDKWKEFGGFIAFYNKETIVRKSEHDVKVWVKIEKEVPEVNADGIFPGDTEEYSLNLWHIDCVNREVGYQTRVEYDKNGNEASTYKYNPNESRESIVPESYEELLYDVLCKKPTQDKGKKKKVKKALIDKDT